MYAVKLVLEGEADLKYGNLTRAEGDSGRVIGGDRGDVVFWGYSIIDGMTHLSSPMLRTKLCFTKEEAQSVAEEVFAEAYDSIGLECVEHS